MDRTTLHRQSPEDGKPNKSSSYHKQMIRWRWKITQTQRMVRSGDWKLILGIQSYGFWQGPVYPNATTNHSSELEFNCGGGCLFNIQEDPSEYTDLAQSHPAKFGEMLALFRERNTTMFEAPRVNPDPQACLRYVAAHGGFVGPYMDPA